MRALMGIYREPEFSPGKVEHDAAILDAVMAELQAPWGAMKRRPLMTRPASCKRRCVRDAPDVRHVPGERRALGRLVAARDSRVRSRSIRRSRSATAIATCSGRG